ncbi:MAG: GAF domain-containing protein, partial [Gammaproteobacteria bacterium]|nr:GAF domain-containing protein [Gammaproteobacteria bacterium]
EPNDIYSLLDVGIRYNGQLVGVFCCEQVGDVMQWNQSQKSYLEQAGKLITFALKPYLQQKFAALF